jgi:hypothetical protein
VRARSRLHSIASGGERLRRSFRAAVMVWGDLIVCGGPRSPSTMLRMVPLPRFAGEDMRRVLTRHFENVSQDRDIAALEAGGQPLLARYRRVVGEAVGNRIASRRALESVLWKLPRVKESTNEGSSRTVALHAVGE